MYQFTQITVNVVFNNYLVEVLLFISLPYKHVVEVL